jgi:hypothetical protein
MWRSTDFWWSNAICLHSPSELCRAGTFVLQWPFGAQQCFAPPNIKYCSHEMQPPQTRVVRSSKERIELAMALRTTPFQAYQTFNPWPQRSLGPAIAPPCVAIQELLHCPTRLTMRYLNHSSCETPVTEIGPPEVGWYLLILSPSFPPRISGWCYST